MLILSLLFGCDDHEFSGGHKSGGETTGEGYEAVRSIFSNNCTTCHATGGTFPALDGDLCTDVVDVNSFQSASSKLVVAGDSSASYLYHKIVGTHLEVGGSGSQMPIGGSLSESDIDMLVSWIDEGANCITSSEPSEEPSGEPSGEPSDDSGDPEPSGEPAEEASAEPSSETYEPDLTNGQSIHDGLCQGCHSGNPAMADGVPNLTDDALADVIQNGTGYMGPQPVSGDDLLDLIAFLRQEYN